MFIKGVFGCSACLSSLYVQFSLFCRPLVCRWISPALFNLSFVGGKLKNYFFKLKPSCLPAGTSTPMKTYFEIIMLLLKKGPSACQRASACRRIHAFTFHFHLCVHVCTVFSRKYHKHHDNFPTGSITPRMFSHGPGLFEQHFQIQKQFKVHYIRQRNALEQSQYSVSVLILVVLIQQLWLRWLSGCRRFCISCVNADVS